MTAKATGKTRAVNLLTDGPAGPFRAIVAAAADGVIGIDANQRIVLFNRAAEQMFGYSAAEAIGHPLTMLLPPAARAGHPARVDTFRASDEAARYMGDRHHASLKGVRADGTEIAVAISILQLSTELGPLMVAHVRDITDRVALLEQQMQLATRDSLTGALNRRAFLEHADTIHRTAAASYAVLMLDLDHFKAVNDNHGHAVGDIALQHFAQLCQTTLRKGDIFARWGGEEFIALLPSASAHEARVVAERIRYRTATRQIELREGARLRHTVSIGVATPEIAGHSFEDVLRRADRALYRAKSDGRNRVIAADADSALARAG